jgi:type IV pilus assembly protein PilA
MKTPQNSAGAFTLVEIMIVAAIIGLLAALAVPAFNKVREAARQKTITNNLRQLAAAAQQYMLAQGASVVAYTDIAGTTTDKYISGIATAAGEDYTTVAIHNVDTQISVASSIITVTYNL